MHDCLYKNNIFFLIFCCFNGIILPFHKSDQIAYFETEDGKRLFTNTAESKEPIVTAYGSYNNCAFRTLKDKKDDFYYQHNCSINGVTEYTGQLPERIISRYIMIDQYGGLWLLFNEKKYIKSALLGIFSLNFYSTGLSTPNRYCIKHLPDKQTLCITYQTKNHEKIVGIVTYQELLSNLTQSRFCNIGEVVQRNNGICQKDLQQFSEEDSEVIQKYLMRNQITVFKEKSEKNNAKRNFFSKFREKVVKNSEKDIFQSNNQNTTSFTSATNISLEQISPAHTMQLPNSTKFKINSQTIPSVCHFETENGKKFSTYAYHDSSCLLSPYGNYGKCALQEIRGEENDFFYRHCCSINGITEYQGIISEKNKKIYTYLMIDKHGGLWALFENEKEIHSQLLDIILPDSKLPTNFIKYSISHLDQNSFCIIYHSKEPNLQLESVHKVIKIISYSELLKNPNLPVYEKVSKAVFRKAGISYEHLAPLNNNEHTMFTEYLQKNEVIIFEDQQKIIDAENKENNFFGQSHLAKTSSDLNNTVKNVSTFTPEKHVSIIHSTAPSTASTVQNIPPVTQTKLMSIIHSIEGILSYQKNRVVIVILKQVIYLLTIAVNYMNKKNVCHK